MRKWIPGAGAVVLTLALASVALANFTQVSNITLTALRAGKSTGLKVDVHSSDLTALGQKPKSARSLLVTFPASTKVDLKTPLVKACGLSDRQLTAQFGPTCPDNSQIGTGSAMANASPLAATVKANVKAYVGKGNIILDVKPTLPGAATIVIHATASGSKLTIPIPTPRLAGISVVVVSLKLNVPALGSGRNALITAGKCVAHKFVVKSHFVYTDHSRLDLQSSSSCS